MKEDKCTKSLAKNQAYGTVHMRDIRKNVLPKFIKVVTRMDTPKSGIRSETGTESNYFSANRSDF